VSQDQHPPTQPAGKQKTAKQALLAMGSRILQNTDPLKGFDAYVCGLHCGKEDPSMQMQAHHYCKQVNAELLQCAIFDGNTEDANLIGIEYIISEELYDSLPAAEKDYWHPHNYEVLSGQLVAPGLPDIAEHELVSTLMNSYGKTWHTWHTGRPDGKGGPGHKVPMGPAMLQWSFNRDGEADESLHAYHLEHMGIDPEQKRRQRSDLIDRAHPQSGVNTLRDAFPDAAPTPPPGVGDRDEDTPAP
jgi:hypothetical protein